MPKFSPSGRRRTARRWRPRARTLRPAASTLPKFIADSSTPTLSVIMLPAVRLYDVVPREQVSPATLPHEVLYVALPTDRSMKLLPACGPASPISFARLDCEDWAQAPNAIPSAAMATAPWVSARKWEVIWGSSDGRLRTSDGLFRQPPCRDPVPPRRTTAV